MIATKGIPRNTIKEGGARTIAGPETATETTRVAMSCRPWAMPQLLLPDTPAVYLVCPTAANVDRIAADAAAGLYASFYINFSTCVPRPILERLAYATAASRSAHRVARVADQYLDFVCLEEGLFSLAQPRAYVALNDPAAAEANITALIDAIALGLFCAV
ncbi:hypothetical protein GUJ93_ZPchr0010g10593 [Zizania palustris]|uniref:Uncharacterized protein n=1 Tax=Zizania palustris TaxID=103762 RepID=A0A8J5WCD9_ZIZPA|nr:hypothetical protein GUJ93_ZPchr0010g10593 [Zizania palustris]